ncbi:MAG: glycerol-3-phosphate acyltransferase [Deltaproteobacteria bacterium]|nr:glycerol-3-phosphate acyltransferase [Deltaproteobacteria bacterium]
MLLGLILLLAYFAGSINFAIITLGLLGKEDPRTKFSGNAGTTNVYRQAGKGWAVVVLLLDAGRAVGLAALALYFLPAALVSWVGTALVAGNRFPCFHRFQGGKGVASFLGFTMLIAPWGTVLSCLVWVVVYGIVRIPFIASFFMVLILGGATALSGDSQTVSITGTVVTVLLIFLNHRKNIVALLAESRQKT